MTGVSPRLSFALKVFVDPRLRWLPSMGEQVAEVLRLAAVVMQTTLAVAPPVFPPLLG